MPYGRILIVDGDITLSEMLQARLKAIGYLVDCAHTGNEALELLNTRWVDLIVISVILQGEMHGVQFFKETKRKRAFSKIPVVVHSSKPGMKKIFKDMGAVAFFVKPHSIDSLLKKLGDILEG